MSHNTVIKGVRIMNLDAQSVITAFTYNLLNRTIRKQFASSGDTLTHTFIYDSLDATNVWKGAMMAACINDSNAVFYHYDNLDWLTAFTVAKTDGTLTDPHTMSFADNGNIMVNSHIGAYNYDSDKPHAVTGITLDSAHANAISAAQCDMHYNLFNQPDTITEGQWQLILYYGPDLTRWKTVLKKNGNVVETHWYVGDSYEKATNNVGSSVHNNIVSGEENAKVICQQGYGTNTYYYVHPDILGSWSVISRQGKRLYRSIHFDPWGNPRKFSNWTLVDSTTLTGFSMPARGFTGHEHLQRFNIINMKGRLYDPVIGRFFSPDNFVQLPDFTQNYNRYSYCLNNPLKYIDPSGEGFADALLWISNILTFPARVITEGVEYINDVLNNDIQESGYFHWDYLAGTASPYPVDTRNIIYNQVDHYDLYDISKSHGSIISADNSLFTYEFYWAGFEINGYEFQTGRNRKTWYQRQKYAKWGQMYIRRVEIDEIDVFLSKTNSYIGCFGTGTKKIKGSVRFTNGTYNGNHFSFKYYPSGWNGGSRAGIKTYNVGKFGKIISKSTMGLSVLYGANDVSNGYLLDGGQWGYHSNMALSRTIGSAGGATLGAEIGASIGSLLWGLGAVPGAFIGGIIGDYYGGKAGEQLIINMY